MSDILDKLAQVAMLGDLETAIRLLKGLMEWAPDDLEPDEMPSEWAEAQTFLEQQEWV